jgi:cell division protease FtsH
MKKDDQDNQAPKKRFPGGFLIFLLATVLVILVVQNLSGEKGAKVGFSHQLEHLMNLDLLDRDSNKKTALNDNLVTFSGKFREGQTDEAKQRYRFLELLNENHELTSEQARLSTELTTLESQVHESAALFLHLSSTPIPKGGYHVVDDVYDTPERQNSIVIAQLPSRETISYKEVDGLATRAKEDTSSEKVGIYGRNLSHLVRSFRAVALGIGSEAMKERLGLMQTSIDQAKGAPEEMFATYNHNQIQLKEVITELNTEVNHARLLQLRSTRGYLENLAVYTSVYEKLDTNGAELNKARTSVASVIWFFNNKEVSTRTLEQQDPEAFSHWYAKAEKEWSGFALNKGLSFKAPDQPRNLVLERTFKSEEPAPNYFSYLITILPIVLIVLLLYFVFSRQMKGMGSSAMNFGKSTAKMLSKSQLKVTFKDVAGVDEGKEELEEIVDFLKDPAKFTTLGARIPKGVLCVGPPGTGKTLIAKAVAGEADRPFFSISGSDFVEMFVGVGASRIRDLFEQAKKNAPCIVFIDEIDAVGRHRGAGIGGGHDEREQTLNQLLVEMDGFDTNEGVILMAATNRPDVLDKALLRPGRFDRQIVLDLPDIKGRYEILKVHARKVKLDPSVELMVIARSTAGCSGADLMNILNESALIGARKGRSAVTQEDVVYACDKVRFGKERRSLEIDENEKRNTAYHEAGHTIVGLVVKGSDPVEKVTIIPRGMSLGATHFQPEKNRVSYWKKELHDKLAVLMGGRVAEDIFLGDVSSGAQMDISQATGLARSMVCKWGMTEQLGQISYDESTAEGSYLMSGSSNKNYSDETAKLIDEQVKKIVSDANDNAIKILSERKEQVDLMASMLLEFETLDKEDIHAIINNTWDAEKKRQKVIDQTDAHIKLPPPPPIEGADPAPQGA